MRIQKSYRSKSNPDAEPYVAQVHDETGLLSCNCRGWITKKVGKVRDCTHCRDLVAEFGLTIEVRDEQQFVVSKATPLAVKPAHSQWDSGEERVRAASSFVNPMLASAMPEGRTPAGYSGFAYVMEEKFDGHRIVMAVTLGHVAAWSRGEKPRTLPAHIVEQALQLPEGIYDGELIVPGKHSYDVTAGMNSGSEALVLFDILRVLDVAVTDRAQDERRELLTVAFAHLDVKQSAIRLAAQFVPSMKIVEEIWERGGEGAILKRQASRYQPGFRSADWIKVKKVASARTTIIGFEAGKVGAYSAVKIVDEKGIETTVKTLNNDTMRQMIADPDSFIGRTLVISYQERTPSGKYRHPMWDHVLPAASATTKGSKK